MIVNNDLIKKLIKLIDDRWVSIEEIESALGVRISIESLNKLGRTGLFEVIYSTLDDTFYIRRVIKSYPTKELSNSGNEKKTNLQMVVDRIRSEIQGIISKPAFEDWLSNNVPDNWRLIYNQLLNDGVIEEVLVSGMVFVKVNK